MFKSPKEVKAGEAARSEAGDGAEEWFPNEERYKGLPISSKSKRSSKDKSEVDSSGPGSKEGANKDAKDGDIYQNEPEGRK